MGFSDRLMFVTPPGDEPLVVTKEPVAGATCPACQSTSVARYPVAHYQGPRIVVKCQDCFHILELRRPFPEEPWPPFRPAMYDAAVSPAERSSVMPIDPTRSDDVHEAAKAVVKQYYAELNGPTENIDPMHLFTPDVHHEIKGNTPISGERNGTDEMARYWASMRENYASMETTVSELVALEDGRVFARSRSICQPKGDGKVYDQKSAYVFTVTDGKLSDIVKTYEDTASMAEQWA